MTDEVPVNKTAYSNSHKAREGAPAPEEKGEKPKLARVTTDEPVRVKTPLGRKIAGAFKGDDIRSVGNYILMDVIIPAAKTAISDAFSQGIERMLFGDGRRPSSASARPGYQATAYNRMSPSAPVRRDEPRVLSQRARASHDFSEVVLADRAQAEIVLDTLREQVDTYNSATVADLYDLVGITGNFVDNKWGWQDLRSASIRRDRQGWLIDLPRPIELA